MYELNLTDYSVKLTRIDDPDFTVSDPSSESGKAKTFTSAIEFMVTNSMIQNVYEYKGNMILQGQIGKAVVKNIQSIDACKRYIVLYILDKDKNLKDRIVFATNDYLAKCPFVFSRNKEMYTNSYQ